MYIHVVDAKNISYYGREIEAMHRARKTMFVDRLGWTDLSTQSDLEIDEFDHEYCSYFLLLSKTGQLLGSCRLTPTNKPNVTTDKLANFFDGSPSVSGSVYEVSRWIPAPGIKELNKQCNLIMMLGLFEFGNKAKASMMISCVGRIVTSAIARAGVPISKIYMPQRYKEGIASGIEFIPSWDNVLHLRESFEIPHSVIRYHEFGKQDNSEIITPIVPAFMSQGASSSENTKSIVK